MSRTFTSIATISMIGFCLSALAQDAPKHEPSTNWFEKEILYGPIDRLNLYHQRNLFHVLAGADAQIDEKEFITEQNKLRSQSFSRPYDTWAALQLFDANENDRIEWMEAFEYRRTMQSLFLARSDWNRDYQLNPMERESLLAALKGADLVQWLRDRDHLDPRPNGGMEVDERYMESTREMREQDRRALELLASEPEPWLSDDDEKRHLASSGLFYINDQDGDGDVTGKDSVLYGQRMREVLKIDCKRELEEALREYDKNGNGTLDPQESDALNAERRAEHAISYDADFTGVFNLNDLEEEARRTIQNNPKSPFLRFVVHLDEAEESAFRKSSDYAYLLILDEFDADRNAVLNVEERESMNRHLSIRDTLDRADPDQLRGIYGEYRSEYWWQFDTDANGKLSENELATLNAAFKHETRGKAPVTQYPFNPWDDTSHLTPEAPVG